MRINNLYELPEHLRKQVEKQIGPMKKNNKHNNIKTMVDNQVFHSGREAIRYGELKLLEQVDEITALKTQVWFLLDQKNSKNRASYYIADFTYYDYKLKEWIVEDSKGHRTAEYILKKKALYNKYGIDIKEV